MQPELSERQDHQAFWTWRWAGQRGLQARLFVCFLPARSWPWSQRAPCECRAAAACCRPLRLSQPALASTQLPLAPERSEELLTPSHPGLNSPPTHHHHHHHQET